MDPEGFGPGSEFGFGNLLRFFGLLPPTTKTDRTQVRHTLGFGYSTPPRQKNLLVFIKLHPRFGPLTSPHNRQVEGSSPSGPTIFHKIQCVIDSYTIRLWVGFWPISADL